MAHLMQTQGIYSGVKTGAKKNSPNEQWLMLQFKIPEAFKGVAIPPDAMNEANLNVFPQSGDYSFLQPGTKYRLELEVSVRKGSSYPEYKIHKIHQG